MATSIGGSSDSSDDAIANATAPYTPTRSPVNACAKAWAKLTKKQLKNGNDFSLPSWRQEFRNFGVAITKESHCKDLRGRATACTCVTSLSYDDINDMAFYLVDFAQQKKDERQKILFDWMKSDEEATWRRS